MKAIIAVSDLHVGSTMGLCPAKVNLIGTGTYEPNKYQKTLLKFWNHFWTVWVPTQVEGADKVFIVINGDIVDGIHHNTVEIISNSWAVQEYAAIDLLTKTIGGVPNNGIFVVKGTEIHVGPSGSSEEKIARAIGAEVNDLGESSSWQWNLDLDGVVFNFAHHISAANASAYETSAPMRELISGMVEAEQWNQPMPNVMVRSHRHRFIPVSIPSIRGRIHSVVTPSWQLRTPFVEKIDRMRMPHIGGIVFKVQGGQTEVCEKLYPLPGPKARKL